MGTRRSDPQGPEALGAVEESLCAKAVGSASWAKARDVKPRPAIIAQDLTNGRRLLDNGGDER